MKGDVMPDLPVRPDVGQLRNQAKDLIRAAKNGDNDASARIRRVSDRQTLAAAQLAVAREYGFASWTKLKLEVERRRVLDRRDLKGLSALLADDPELATATMEHWCDHPLGAAPLSYVAMLRYDTSRGGWRNLKGTAAMAEALIDSGAPVNGRPGDPETPLITAASYGDAEVARVLLAAGADLEVQAAPDAGGVPGGTALLHAAVFGMAELVDLLVAAGAQVNTIEEAAAVGDITVWLTPETPIEARIRALVMATDHQRLDVIDQLIAAGTPVDATDAEFGGHPLRTAAGNGRPESVRLLLAHGADANLKDPQHHRTPLGWCRHNRASAADTDPYDEVEAILRPLTSIPG
jgi:ankyrin repeat protein